MEENELSLIELIGIVFKKWLRLVLITVIIGIIGSIALIYYESGKKTYVSSFTFDGSTLISYEYPDKEQPQIIEINHKYVDESSYSPLDLISLDAIKEADKITQEKCSDYNSIVVKNDKGEVVGTSLGNFVSFEEKTEKLSATGEVSSTYTFTIKESCFATQEHAKTFVEALARYVERKNIEKVATIDYATKLNNLNQKTFKNTIDVLESEKEYIEECYDKLIQNYGDLVLENGLRLSDLKKQFSINYGLLNITGSSASLDKIVESEKLVKDWEYAENELNSKKALISNQKAQAEAIYNDLYEKFQQSSEVASLKAEIATYEYELKEIERILSSKNDVEFNNKINSANEKINSAESFLRKEASSLKDITEEILKNTDSVKFTSGGIVTLSGGMSSLVAIIISLFLGFVVGVFVNIFDYNIQEYKNKKKLLK